MDRLQIGNIGEPIRLTEVNLIGVTAEAGRGGTQAKVWHRLALTSDQALFQKIVGNLASVIEHAAERAGTPKSLSHADTVLPVIRPDDEAELWVDAAAMCIYAALKRPGGVEAGSVLFESDIADVTGMCFRSSISDPRIGSSAFSGRVGASVSISTSIPTASWPSKKPSGSSGPSIGA